MYVDPGDVIYNAEFPLAPPDIIFGPEDEDFHPLHMTGAEGEGDLKSLTRNILSDWNNKDPTRLLALIQELRLLTVAIVMEIGIFYDSGKTAKKFIYLFFLNRDQYMSYQRKRVGEVDDDRLKFEISTICSREVIFWHINLVSDGKRFENPALCCFLNLNCNSFI